MSDPDPSAIPAAINTPFASQKPPLRGVVRNFLLLFLPLATLFIALYLLLQYKEFETRSSVRITEAAEHIDLAHTLIARDLEIIAGDLFVLAHCESLRRFTNHPTEKLQRAVEKRFLTFARDRKLYGQIRYIDRSGHERVRINYDRGRAEAVPGDQLQDKSDRYYVKEALPLAAGRIYVSPIDLNVEHGEVERPFKPILRIATPLHDDVGDPAGLLLFNYLAEPMLNRFALHRGERNEIATHMVLNTEGYWLHAEDPTREWGFMFGREQTFASEHPRLWEEMGQRERGRGEDFDGVYLFNTIDPGRLITAHFSGFEEKPVDLGNGDPARPSTLRLVSRVPTEAITFSPFAPTTPWAPLVLLTLLATGAFACWLAAYARAERHHAHTLLRLLSRGVEQSPAAIIITDAGGHIEYVNERFESVSGYRAAEVLGHNPRMLRSGETTVEEYQTLWRTITEGEAWQGEFHNRRRDGSHYWAAANISPILDDGGEITHFIGIQEDITERRRMREELRRLATTDPLTGAFNRRHFLGLMQEEIERSLRYDHPLSFLFLDLDHFKAVNDQHGHQAGDIALQRVVATIRDELRGQDAISRYGGEEFVVSLPETGLEEARALAERLRRSVAELELTNEHGTFNVTISVGCAEWRREEPLEQVFSRADTALYNAKANGRNRVEADALVESGGAPRPVG